MKKVFTFLFILVVLLGFSIQANAVLKLRGEGTSAEGTFRLIYDTDFNITWYDYTNSGDVWQNQVIWADALSVTFGSNIYTDWRLPSALNSDGTYPCSRYNCTGSEMGHLFYTELGNKAGGPLTNKGDFQNLQVGYYWSGTEYAIDTNFAWEFSTGNGYQKYYQKRYNVYAIAVRPGDVSVYAFNLPDTGQTKCYQDVSPYDEIPCAGTWQDGLYNINPMSFTDNGNGTVTDKNTDLMWQKQDIGNNAGMYYNWYEASSRCDNLVLSGYYDWRLPAENELITIVDFAIPSPGPTIRTDYFPKTKSGAYWSSTTDAGDQNWAWYINFGGGYSESTAKNANRYGRCVRGGQVGATTFTDGNNGTVTDNKTGLVWQQAEPGKMTWGDALSYCEGLPLGDKTDWRLPNIKELESLIDYSRYNPVIDTTFFPNVSASFYWSSTTIPGSPFAWGAGFDYGEVIGLFKYIKNYIDDYNVRCVRGAGPFGDLDVDGYTSDMDCNDNDALINPGASDMNCNGIDENCNGTADENYIPTQTICGIGACIATGQNICQNGVIVDTCTPGSPVAETCDSKDNDCDGQVDEGLTYQTMCGIGACASTGQLICQNGSTIDTCTPGTPGTEGPFGNETCNDGNDNDCNGFTDGNDTNCKAPVSDLTVTSVSDPPTSRKRGSSFTVTAKIKNKGVGAAEKEFTIGYYLSKNRDKRINKVADFMLTDNIIVSSLLAGASSKAKIPLTIPMDTPIGKYYVKVCADNRFDIAETNEDNNCRASVGKIKVK